MKKLLITSTILLFSTNTIAEWTKISDSDKNGGYTIYTDLTTKSKVNDKVKMWILIDYKIKQEDTGVYFLSKKVRRKYDCQTKHVRLLAFKLYSWDMGQGELVRAYSQPQKWEEVQSAGIDDSEWNAACGNE
ncbi:MAG: hypothetical protein H6936_13810 [Burkholderiales bacterium]|nr:hypothetical protein [Burkholderiales bacterium]